MRCLAMPLLRAGTLTLVLTVCAPSFRPLHAALPNQGNPILPTPQTAGGDETLSPESLVAALEHALAEGHNDKAREILGQVLKRAWVPPDVLLKAGLALARRELYSEAAQAFARCVRENPAIFAAHYDLALAEFAQQKLPEARAALDDAPRRSATEELALLYLRGKIESALGRTSEAQHDLEAAFSAAPQQENYALDLGLLYLRERAYSQAEDTFRRGASFNPQSRFLTLGLAFAQFLQGRQAQSIQNSMKVLAQQPDFSPARLLMAFALYMDGKFDQAENVAGEGLATPGSPAYLYYLHAVILLKRRSSDQEQVLRELAIAERGVPSCSLCYIAQSKAHEALGNLQAAIADLETAIRLAPSYPEAWYRLAPLYERVGRLADATKARGQFQKFKADKENRESEMLRNVFMQTLSGTEAAPASPGN